MKIIDYFALSLEDQRQLLQNLYPIYNEIEAKLLSLGGKTVDPLPWPSGWLEQLLLRSIAFGDYIIQDTYSTNAHYNVSRLTHHDIMLKPTVGFALNNNGVWKQHSWAMYYDRIIETTNRRKFYYGMILTTEEEKHFHHLALPSVFNVLCTEFGT